MVQHVEIELESNSVEFLMIGWIVFETLAFLTINSIFANFGTFFTSEITGIYAKYTIIRHIFPDCQQTRFKVENPVLYICRYFCEDSKSVLVFFFCRSKIGVISFLRNTEEVTFEEKQKINRILFYYAIFSQFYPIFCGVPAALELQDCERSFDTTHRLV